ncbi:MAG: hypothetical protein ABSE95_17245 [Thermodesulfobacteriota bacterium]|jgi:hypothetical protein
MLRSQSGKGCLTIILLILILGVVGLWLFFSQLGIPLEGTGNEDAHIVLSQEGIGEHVRAQTGYGVILDCEGVIESPPGEYWLTIMTDDEVAFEGKLMAGQKHHYKLKTRWGKAMTIFTHKLKGLSGQKEVKVTYLFTYTYSYKSLLNRLISWGD